ncbi:MAG TPA: hypothetical protein VHM90_20790 [Phycisphaerae bacterium]|nr:hypothetical protein [Phycisphaerae bacterium]
MARVSIQKTSGASRIRFVMLDAELSDGDLSQVTQAIQNALRPPTPAAAPTKVVVANGQRVSALGVPDHDPDASSEVEEEVVEDAAVETTMPGASRAPRKFRTPKVLDTDLLSEPSFAAFAAAKNPASDMMRFLVVAAWFKQARGVDAIGADHVYTCYRAVKWPSGIEDFAQPLRDLKRRQLLVQAEKGTYAINHLGLAEVDKLGVGN